MTELGIFSVMWSEHCCYKSSRMHLEDAADPGAARAAGPRRERRRGRHRRRPGRGLQDRIAQPSVLHRALSGRGHRRRRHHPRHLHHGRAADRAAGLPALRRSTTDGACKRRIVAGVVAGIAGYGNASASRPSAARSSSTVLHGNPLVNVFCLGIAKADDIFKGKAEGVGNPVSMSARRPVATASTARRWPRPSSTRSRREKRPTVQVGDPFMEKLLLEACLEVMKTGAIVGIQDMGAAGLTCSTCEMGCARRRGMEIDVDAGAAARDRHDAYEIMLSESQERMLLVAEEGPRGRGRARSSKSGTCTPRHRRRDRRRPGARQG